MCYNSERACPPRISSILSLLVPCSPTHPSPTHPQPIPNPRTLVFHHHRFPLLLLVSFPSLSLPLSPSPKTHKQPATEQKPPKHRLEDSAYPSAKGPAQGKTNGPFSFPERMMLMVEKGKGKGKGKGSAGEPVCGRRGGDVY